jgi:hypothetical protein
MQVSDDEFAYLYADTQGGAGHKYHFIKDKRLFHSIEMRDDLPSIVGVQENGTPSGAQGIGMCRIWAKDADGVVREIPLDNCLLIPELRSNIFNVHFANNHRGFKCDVNVGSESITYQGFVFPMTSDYMITSVWPDDFEALEKVEVQQAKVLTRGKYGSTYVMADKNSTKEDAMLEVVSSRMNDPSPARLANMSRVVDGVPDVVRRANMISQY